MDTPDSDEFPEEKGENVVLAEQLVAQEQDLEKQEEPTLSEPLSGHEDEPTQRTLKKALVIFAVLLALAGAAWLVHRRTGRTEAEGEQDNTLQTPLEDAISTEQDPGGLLAVLPDAEVSDLTREQEKTSVPVQEEDQTPKVPVTEPPTESQASQLGEPVFRGVPASPSSKAEREVQMAGEPDKTDGPIVLQTKPGPGFSETPAPPPVADKLLDAGRTKPAGPKKIAPKRPPATKVSPEKSLKRTISRSQWIVYRLLPYLLLAILTAGLLTALLSLVVHWPIELPQHEEESESACSANVWIDYFTRLRERYHPPEWIREEPPSGPSGPPARPGQESMEDPLETTPVSREEQIRWARLRHDDHPNVVGSRAWRQAAYKAIEANPDGLHTMLNEVGEEGRGLLEKDGAFRHALLKGILKGPPQIQQQIHLWRFAVEQPLAILAREKGQLPWLRPNLKLTIEQKDSIAETFLKHLSGPRQVAQAALIRMMHNLDVWPELGRQANTEYWTGLSTAWFAQSVVASEQPRHLLMSNVPTHYWPEELQSSARRIAQNLAQGLKLSPERQLGLLRSTAKRLPMLGWAVANQPPMRQLAVSSNDPQVLSVLAAHRPNYSIDEFAALYDQAVVSGKKTKASLRDFFFRALIFCDLPLDEWAGQVRGLGLLDPIKPQGTTAAEWKSALTKPEAVIAEMLRSGSPSVFLSRKALPIDWRIQDARPVMNSLLAGASDEQLEEILGRALGKADNSSILPTILSYLPTDKVIKMAIGENAALSETIAAQGCRFSPRDLDMELLMPQTISMSHMEQVRRLVYFTELKDENAAFLSQQLIQLLKLEAGGTPESTTKTLHEVIIPALESLRLRERDERGGVYAVSKKIAQTVLQNFGQDDRAYNYLRLAQQPKLLLVHQYAAKPLFFPEYLWKKYKM